MKSTAEVKARIIEIENKLMKITTLMEIEMNKNSSMRNIGFLNFLFKEKAIYQFALSELNNIIES